MLCMNVFTSSSFFGGSSRKAWLYVMWMWRHMRQYRNVFEWEKKRSSTDKKCSYVLELEQDKLFVRTGRRWKLRGNKRRKELWGARGERGGRRFSWSYSQFSDPRAPWHVVVVVTDSHAASNPKHSNPFLGRDLCLDTFIFFFVSLLQALSRYIKTFYLRCQLFSFTSTAHISQFPPTHICQ